MPDCGRSKAFAALRSVGCFSLPVQREAAMAKHGPDASRCDQAASVPCAPRGPRRRCTTRFIQMCAHVRSSVRCRTRPALRPWELSIQEQKRSRGTGRMAMLDAGSQERRNGVSCFCLSESPSAATEPAGKTRRATCMDARRFSTRQGCRVGKSRRRSEPDALAQRARRQGGLSLGYCSSHEQREPTRSPKGTKSLCSRNEGGDKCAWA